METQTQTTPATPPAQNETKAVATRPAAPIAVGSRGLALTSFDDVWRFASTVVQSGLAPKGLTTVASVFVATVNGMELGIPHFAAVANTAVINGRPTLWGDIVLGLVRSSGELERIREWWELNGKRVDRIPAVLDDTLTAVCEVKRSGAEPVVATFSVAQAKRAKLWEKEGPWSQYPERMLKSRARTFALRDEFGDVLKGVRIAEEAADIVDMDPSQVTVETVSNPPAAPAAVAATRARKVGIDKAKPAEIAPPPFTAPEQKQAAPAPQTIEVQATVEDAAATAPSESKPAVELFQNANAGPSTAAPEGKVKTPQEMLAFLITKEGATFEDFIEGVRSANWIEPHKLTWTAWADVPDDTARRLVNARIGLLKYTTTAKAARLAKASA